MNAVPASAVVLVAVILLVIWLFLAHMISNRKEDARPRFLLGLMEAPPPSADDPDLAAPRGEAKQPRG